MKKKRRLKKKFVVFLQTYALFFISYFTLTSFAKFAVLLNANSNVSVAKWNVSVEGEDNKTLPTIIIGDSDTYQNYELSVISKSEIAINYSVIISNVPTGVKIQVDDEIIYSEDDNKIIMVNLGAFNADDINTKHTHKFTIMVPKGVNDFTNQTLDIDVIFTQNRL